MNEKSVSLYLRAIYELTERETEITTTNIAKYLSISLASVSEMLSKLSDNGYLVHTPYGKTGLTSKGIHEAQLAIRRQRLTKEFLVRILKLPKKEATSQTETMSYTINSKTDIEMCRMMKRPLKDSEGNFIPHCEKKMDCATCLARK